MQIYLAPMEGITGYIYRNAHRSYYNTIDTYITPFISPNQNRCMNTREHEDVLLQHNRGMHVIPQILTNRSELFVRTARELYDMGYRELNLNLGCPSGTVVSKKKGAGFLSEPQMLEQFLDEIFEALDGIMKISVKTRTGMEAQEEFRALLDIYNKYPMSELIVHPRLRKDFYRGRVSPDSFELALERARMPVCYNGDIFTKEDYDCFAERFPQVEKIMLGRGILRDPNLPGVIRGKEERDMRRLRAFHDTLVKDYSEVLSGDRNLLFKLKELWFYLGNSFQNADRYLKLIKKAQHMPEYCAAVDALFRENI